MALIGPKSSKSNPVNMLREHVSTFFYWVKVGRTKFREKEEIGAIFREMDGAKYLFDQATSGTMYDYQRKLERNVWAAAMHKYGGELQRLREAMLRAADACEARKALEEKEAAEKAKEEARARDAADESLTLREQIEREEAREEEEDEREAETPAEYEAESGAAMTVEDCKELWTIYQHLNGEYKKMKKAADRWIADNPESGCLGAVLFLFAVPLAAAGALIHFL